MRETISAMLYLIILAITIYFIIYNIVILIKKQNITIKSLKIRSISTFLLALFHAIRIFLEYDHIGNFIQSIIFATSWFILSIFFLKLLINLKEEEKEMYNDSSSKNIIIDVDYKEVE